MPDFITITIICAIAIYYNPSAQELSSQGSLIASYSRQPQPPSKMSSTKLGAISLLPIVSRRFLTLQSENFAQYSVSPCLDRAMTLPCQRLIPRYFENKLSREAEAISESEHAATTLKVSMVGKITSRQGIDPWWESCR
jgi:hypothetical protein